MAGRTDLEQLVYTMSADIRGMQRQLARAANDVDGTSRKIERRIEQQGVNVGKALKNVFDRSKFKLIEDGSARMSVFGSAIEPLGPLGIAAAAGVVALAEAFHQAREAMAFVDELHDMAEKLHVTTDALQEYRYAVRAAGGEEKGADDALESFSITLGKAQTGLPKALKAFKELFGNNFTAADVKRMGDVETALGKVSARIAQLKSPAQRDAIIDQLGLTGMKELVQQGPSGMARLRSEAHSAGVVMDAELIKRTADLNDNLETAANKIKVNLATAFVAAGPALLQLVTYAAQLAHFVANALDDMNSIDKRGTDHLKNVRADMVARDQAGGLGALIYGASDKKKIAQIDAILAKRAKEPKPEGTAKGDAELNDQTPQTGPTAAEKRQRGLEALDSAMRAALQAQMGLTDNIEELARLKLQEIDVELKKRVDQLQGDIAQGKIDAALAKQAIAKEQQAAADQKALVRRQAAERDDEVYFQSQQKIGQIYDQIASINESLARTVQARLDIERRALAKRQRQERDAQEREFDLQKSHGSYSESRANAERASLRDRQAAEVRGMETNAVRDLASDFKSGLLDAFEALRTGGAAGVMDYLVSRFRTGLLDAFADAAAQKLAASVLSGGKGGGIIGAVAGVFGMGKRAVGGPVSAGQPYVVGESGQEVFVPGVNGRIIPNHMLGRGGGGRSTVIHQNIDARGAMLTEDFIRYVDNRAAQAERNATIRGVAASSQLVPARMGKKQRQRFR